MNYEKAYKEALERAKLVIKECGDNKGRISMIESIFPELAESKDEKIRKALVRFHKSTIDVDGIKGEDILAWLEKQKSVGEIVERCKNSWYNEGKIAGKFEGITDDEKYQQGWHDALEKQGEQNITDKVENYCEDCINRKGCINCENGNLKETEYKVEPKFRKDDWIACEELNTARIINIDDDRYEVEFIDGGKGFPHIDYIDRNFHLWTIQDAKDGDVLYSLDSKQPFIFKHRKPNEQAAVYCGINTYGKFFIGNTKDCVITTDKYIPADKFQRDLLFKKMQEAGYQWDAEKKELKKIELKPATYEMNLEYAAKSFLETLSHSPYNNRPVVDAQVVTEELLKFLANPSDYNPDAINQVKSAQVWSDEDEENNNGTNGRI